MVELFSYNEKKGIYLIIFCMAYVTFSFLTLDISPAPFYAETWMAEPSWNLLRFGKLNHMVGDWGAKGFLFYTQGILEYLSYLPFIEIFGVSPFSYRLPSLLSGILMLYYSYLFGKALGGKYTPLLSIIFVSSSAGFFIASHTARASIYIGTVTVIMIYYLYKFTISSDENKRKYTILCAIFISLPVYFYWGGLPLSMTGFLFFILNLKRKMESVKYLIYLISTIIIMIAIWVVINLIFLDFDIFCDQIKLIIGQGTGVAAERFPPMWKDGGIFSAYFFNYQKGSNLLELIPFVLSIFIIIKAKLESCCLLKYFGIYILCHLFIYQGPSFHKAITFVPIMMLICAHGVNYYISKPGKHKFISFPMFVKYFIIVILAICFIKQGLMVKRHSKAEFPGNIARVKEHIPEKVTVLGDMHYWGGLADRNLMLGSSFFLVRAINDLGTSGNSSYNYTLNFFRLLRDLKVGYIIMDDQLSELFVNNGFYDYEFSDAIMKKTAEFPENYYATFDYARKGIVKIYKLDYPDDLGMLEQSFLNNKDVVESMNGRNIY